MPRAGPRREQVQVRLLPEVVYYLDQRAEEEELHDERGRPNRSAMIRLMLTFAAQRMPKGWRPAPSEREPQ